MILNLNAAGVPMKLVYTLAAELEQDPEQVEDVQALTQDRSRPEMGLKGTHGLFGSDAWWRSIHEGTMPQLTRSGIILELYVAGQDASEPNAVRILLEDGLTRHESIYANDKADVRLYRVGCRVDIAYVMDELKQPAPGGGVSYSEFPLEVAVSLRPVR